MVRIRAFENAAEIASQGGVSAYGQSAAGTARVRGPLHLSTGQEAVATGVCAHLHPATTTSPPPTEGTATRWPRARTWAA
jgi:TPP-dependent pyruvate/acetoin dehydrogenase alpha subunit